MIRVTHRISLDESELQESFIRASGPGGQHVNKTDSAVQLRFDVAASPNIPDDVKARLVRLAGSRMTAAGVLIIVGDTYRSQLRNREDVRERLIDLIRDATVVPKNRRPTKPTYGSQQRRLEGKAKRSAVKQGRRGPADD
ncbi:alternative ribosome rescue aminoacyl-tRNA hydrolase ArfB [Azospirillum isscasi]|uniref:Alternative ribosome rescue aminoacyl-tRNA hydrolase ArfB n=1 Tax=Azospirillum isscasi TaxID=3053926 RepID=A0ABU0WKA8_9PROT|nr:alternative ribosome rescue aminoacyl-tRNA hydrolase ArfB [Azospirillum isscasi]MDQ2104655.1 alternative ribosome rescue aminoacyl-tRNA hydrolase ArfB [Azospirillum isscasi]